MLLGGHILASRKITVPSYLGSGGTEELGFLERKIFESPGATHSNLPTEVYNVKFKVLLTLKIKPP